MTAAASDQTPKTITIEKEKFLIHEGENSTQMYYLVKGTMGVFKRKGDGLAQIGNILEGEIVGEMSFLDKAPRSASVKALVDCELIEIPHEKFEAFFKSQPAWYQALVHTLLDRLRRANARIRV